MEKQTIERVSVPYQVGYGVAYKEDDLNTYRVEISYINSPSYNITVKEFSSGLALIKALNSDLYLQQNIIGVKITYIGEGLKLNLPQGVLV